jgi:PAS domain S-box-containing protein
MGFNFLVKPGNIHLNDSYTGILRDGILLTVNIDIFALIHFAAFIIDVLFISFILFKNLHSRVNRFCAALIFTFALWSFAYGCLSLTESSAAAFWWVTLAFIGGVTQPVCAFYLFFSISKKDQLIKNRNIMYVLFASIGVFILLQILGHSIFSAGQTSFGWIALPTRSVFYWLFILFSQIVFIVSIGYMVFFGLTSANRREKMQIKWIIIFSIFALILGTLTNVIFPVLNQGRYAQFGDLAYLIWETGLIIAVTKYGLMSVNPQTASNEIISTMSDSLFLLDNEGAIKLVNQAAMDLFGKDQKQMIGRKLRSLVRDPLVVDQMLEVASQKGKILNSELAYLSSENRNYTLLVSASTVRDKLNTELGFVLVVRDITERATMIADLRRLYARELEQRMELEEEAKARGMFIDILAHELRTPLTPMLNSVSILSQLVESDPASKLRRLVKIIDDSVRGIGQRLDDLLDLARYSRGTFNLNIQPCNMKAFFERIILLFESTLDQNKNKFIVEIPEDLPVVNIDASRLEQVINNLLSNAQKYNSPQGNIIFKAAINDQELKIEVKDDGPGIPKQEIENLFKPYHRIQQDRLVPGLGLGLAVCKQIVEAHGGKIWVESKPGSGAKFCFAIPVSRVWNRATRSISSDKNGI